MARFILVLTSTGRVCDIAPAPFDVHPDFEWLDISNDPQSDEDVMTCKIVDGRLVRIING